MKKTSLRVLSFVVLLTIIFSTVPIVAINSNDYQSETAYVENLINKISNEKTQYVIMDSLKLYKFGSGSTYKLYKLSPKGFAIYDNESSVIEEISLYSENIPYLFNAKLKYYYAGPMNYYVEKEGQYINLSDGTVLVEDEINKIIDAENRLSTLRQSRTGGSVNKGYIVKVHNMSGSSYFTSQIQDDFGYNINGTCTHIACAITLGFYDNYVNDLFVPFLYESGYGTNEAFHQYLQFFLGSSACGLQSAAGGLSTYLSVVNLSGVTTNYEIGNHIAVYSRVCSMIANNRPVIAAMFTSYNPYCPINHSVVVYSYTVVKLGGIVDSIYYTVHTGWHDNPIQSYSYDWFADDLYLS